MRNVQNTPDRRILLLNHDLMSGVAIANAAKSQGFAVDRAGSVDELVQRLRTAAVRYDLVVLDMNLSIEFETLAELIAGSSVLPPIIGFGPHVDIEGRRAAKQAGLTRIYANSEFHRDMGSIITRYARNHDKNAGG